MTPVTIYDTTLRDGTQGTGISFSTHDKIRVAEKLQVELATAKSNLDLLKEEHRLSIEANKEFRNFFI